MAVLYDFLVPGHDTYNWLLRYSTVLRTSFRNFGG